MLINLKSLKNIALRTLPGIVIGLILLAFPFPGLPVLILPISLPIVFFLRACQQELNFHPPKAIVTDEQPTPIPLCPKKISLPVQLLRSIELSEFEHLLQQHKSPVYQNLKNKLQHYKDFFEKKEPITQQKLLHLKNPVTIEGVTKNVRWTQVVERKSLEHCLFSSDALNEKELKLRNFLMDRKTRITYCYDGYPVWLYHFSILVRKMLTKAKEIAVDLRERKETNMTVHVNDPSINHFELINSRKNTHRRS